MIPTYRCISKSQDRKKFVLQDLQSQKQYRVDRTELKTKLSANQVRITNLQIDNQGRLVDKQETNLDKQENQQNTARKLADMTNRELKEYIDSLSENDVKTLVQVASLFKNIPSTKISYGDIAYALQELMLKYVDTKYATVNNVLKLHSDVIYDDDEWNKVETDITTLAFTIYYEENIYIGKTHKQEIDVQVVNVFMSLTKDGYEIQVLDYKYKVAYDYRHILDILEDEDNCSSTTIGFNDNLKNAMKKVKLLIDDKFKSSLKDVKDSVKEIKNKYKNGYVY